MISGLRRLFAHSGDAGSQLAVAPLSRPTLAVESLWMRARLSPAPDVSVSVRSIQSMLSERAARMIH